MLWRWRGVSADALVARARAGDMLLMSGRGLFAAAQEWFSNSWYSHVGVVCVAHGEKCVLHATPHDDGLANYAPGAGAVRVTPLRAFIDAYLDDAGLDLALRPLHGVSDEPGPDGRSARDALNAALLATARERAPLPFTTSAGTFLAVRYPAWGGLLAGAVALAARAGLAAPRGLVEQGHRSIFCTELLARAYAAAGVFRADALDTQFRLAPGDLGAHATPVRSVLDVGVADGHLPFADARYYFGPEVCVN